ncbi:ABC transporter ATP-binding protein [Alcaligenes aquatilis]|uniref:ABC transporter ATP-binding protein n=1 Tax=Alcaligenes aquatilis TaxID=323284 RepID=UPI002AA93DFB|nr:ABC transporter ATP-binding protein [Alcaligenes faecalis]
MSVPVIEFKQVSVSVPVQGQSVELLRKVSFAVQAGRTLGLVGESGAGKSMIGRVISGMLPNNLRLSSGQVCFQGSVVTGAQMRRLLGRKVAFVPQEPLSSLNPVLTIRQQMFEHLARLGISRASREQYCLERLEEVGLPDPPSMLGRYAHELSGGQCQRILIAMAFSGDPELIVADEPTTALDVITQAQIIRILRDVQQRHQTAVILITHDLRMAAHVCDEVAVLYAGDVVEQGPAADVLDTPLHPYSWALKNATPALNGPLYALPSLADIMPGLKDMRDLPGCRFARRCPTRNALCEQRVPELEAVEPGHWVSCAGPCQTRDAAAQAALHVLPQGPSEALAPLVEFQNVERSYRVTRNGRRSLMVALRPLSLSVRPGEMVGVVGESGSGKSTVARLMVGLLQPSGGQVLVQGQSREQFAKGQGESLSQTIQMVFQDPDSALNPRRSVQQLVTQVLELQPGMTPEQRRQKADELMAQVGIAQDAGLRFPSELSGGQKQRVNIARALCVQPRLLVADEIVSGLDVSVQALILNLLLRLNKELGVAVVFISHDLSVIRYLCTRVLVMKNGEVVEQGNTAEVFAKPQHSYTRLLLGSVPPDDSSQTWPAPLDCPSQTVGDVAPALVPAMAV